jgi:hypothetical protein
MSRKKLKANGAKPAPRPSYPTDPNVLVDQVDAAAILDVTPRSMERWRLIGDGPPFIRISSRCVRYRLGDLHEWVASRRQTSTTQAAAAVT